MLKRAAVLLVVAVLAAAAVAVTTQAERAAPTTGEDARVESLFLGTTRSTPWQLVKRVPLGFDAHHPEGLARVGDRFFLSTVEVLEPTVRCPATWTAPTAHPAVGAAD
jgi:Family of unknown function (DUF6454)